MPDIFVSQPKPKSKPLKKTHPARPERSRRARPDSPTGERREPVERVHPERPKGVEGPPPSSSPKFTKNVLAALSYKPKEISFETQRKKEKIILLMRRHWVTNLGWLLLALTLLLLPLFSSFLPFFQLLPNRFKFISLLVWYLLTFAFVIENFLNWFFNVYIVTDERVVDIDFYSLIYKEISDTRIENIQDVTYRMGGLFRAILNYGNVLIQTAAEHPVFEFEATPKPAWVVQQINRVIEKKQK